MLNLEDPASISDWYEPPGQLFKDEVKVGDPPWLGRRQGCTRAAGSRPTYSQRRGKKARTRGRAKTDCVLAKASGGAVEAHWPTGAGGEKHGPAMWPRLGLPAVVRFDAEVLLAGVTGVQCV